MFSATILTLYPDMFPGPLGHSLTGKALEQGIWSLDTIHIRDFATDKHRTVDDTPYGGGAGMVLRPDIIDSALTHAKAQKPDATCVYLTPRGVPFTQKIAHELVKKPVIMLCGRFEAVDERVLQKHQPLEISLGDFILCGGEVAAMAMLEACVRLRPGVIGDAESLDEESFGNHANYAGLLEYPHYTRPPVWNGMQVPEVLQGGNHAAIRHWRLEEAQKATKARRPDLWKKYNDHET